MLKTTRLLGSLAVAALALSACTDNSIVAELPTADTVVREGANNGAIIPGKYIVVLKGDADRRMPANASYNARVAVSKDIAAGVLRRNGIAAAPEQAYGKVFVGFSAALSHADVAKLAKDADVLSIEPDRIMAMGKPNTSGGGGTNTQVTPWGITRVGGGTNYTGTAVAWVIDSGIDLDHPDLNVDTGRSRSFMTSAKESKTADDGTGHGTHVAGTIAAINNTFGVVGVAAGARVVAVRVLGSDGTGPYSGIIAGVDYVAATGAPGDVANMSLAGPASATLDNAVVNAASTGIRFVVAAANNSADANNYSPARANGNNIYTISASDINDVFASFSNYGTPVDFCEPGVNIRSTYRGGAYASMNGTSMAAPHASGLLLLGAINNGGFVSGDPDGNPDVIGVR